MGDGGGGYATAAATLIAAGVQTYVSIDQANKQREQAAQATAQQKEAQDAQLKAYQEGLDQQQKDRDKYIADQKAAQNAADAEAKALEDRNAAGDAAQAKKNKYRGGGRQSTILTSPLGIPDEAGANKTLLGT